MVGDIFISPRRLGWCVFALVGLVGAVKGARMGRGRMDHMAHEEEPAFAEPPACPLPSPRRSSPAASSESAHTADASV